MNNSQPRILVFARFFDPAYRGGGPIQTLRALVSTSPPSLAIDVLSSNTDLGTIAPLLQTPDCWISRNRCRVWYATPRLPNVISAFRLAGQDPVPTIIYLNSFFDSLYSILPQVMHRFGWSRGARILLAPRGELNIGALAINRRKKQMFVAIYKLLLLDTSVLWHASTEYEADDIRRTVGRDAKVIVRENETSLPRNAYRRPPRSVGRCRVVFASRAVPKKGLHTLLLSLRDVSAEIELEVIGAFESANYRIECLSAIHDLPTNVSVRLTGPLPHKSLLERLRNADLMAFPTHGENFGHIIFEALSQGCPVICSVHTPWTQRIVAGGGLTIDPNTPSGWTGALQKFASLHIDEWEVRSTRASDVFDEWSSEEKGQHVFDRAMEILADSRGWRQPRRTSY